MPPPWEPSGDPPKNSSADWRPTASKNEAPQRIFYLNESSAVARLKPTTGAQRVLPGLIQSSGLIRTRSSGFRQAILGACAPPLGPARAVVLRERLVLGAAFSSIGISGLIKPADYLRCRSTPLCIEGRGPGSRSAGALRQPGSPTDCAVLLLLNRTPKGVRRIVIAVHLRWRGGLGGFAGLSNLDR
jgi:hypothetical protein